MRPQGNAAETGAGPAGVHEPPQHRGGPVRGPDAPLNCTEAAPGISASELKGPHYSLQNKGRCVPEAQTAVGTMVRATAGPDPHFRGYY